jgi:hypothetical protein
VSEAIGLTAMVGPAGARIAARLAITVSRDTATAHAIPDRTIGATPVLDIDDVAILRGHSSCTSQRRRTSCEPAAPRDVAGVTVRNVDLDAGGSYG